MWNKSFVDFIDTFVDTIKSYDFFVDWNKVANHVRQIEIQLNLLNVLIGKQDIEREFKSLITSYPEVIAALPILIATRNESINILNDKLEIEQCMFVVRENNEIDQEKYYQFFKKSGLELLVREKKIKNFVDYVFGVEVGMDTNARKNRTGTRMENLVEGYIQVLCEKNTDLAYLKQATKAKIFDEWAYKIQLDKTDRRFDFAIYKKSSKKLYLIEANFYEGGGSKLKSTAGEYISLESFLNLQGVDFIWVTDGKGWHTAFNALEETYNKNKYVVNIHLLKTGVLEEIIG